MKVSIIIPSKPGTDISFIREQLKNIDFSNFSVEFFFVEGTFPPLQRNAAITKTSGDYVFFFDDDIMIPKDIIIKTIAHFDNEKVAVVGGPNLTPESDSLFAQLSGEVLSSTLATGRASVRWKKGKADYNATEKELHGCFLCFKGDVIRKYLFPEDMFPNDENELINRLRSDGYKLYYIPECYVYHKRRSTLRSYLKQVHISGKGRAGLIKRRGIKGNLFYFVPIIFLFYLALIPVLAQIIKMFLAPLFFYFILGISSSIIACVRKEKTFFLLMAPLILISHITYALGFLKGLFMLEKFSKEVLSMKILSMENL